MPDPQDQRDKNDDNRSDRAAELTTKDNDNETKGASDGVHQGRRDTGGYVPSK